MKKSNFLFGVLAIVYLAISVLNLVGVVTVGTNILIGLSLSALLMSMSDIFSGVAYSCTIDNELSYIYFISSNFIEQQFANHTVPATFSIDINNVKKNIDSRRKRNNTPSHPDAYQKDKLNTLLNRLSVGCKVLAIAAFVFTPFLLPITQSAISIFLTLLAFSFVCVNLHIGEITLEKIQEKDHFMNETVAIINSVYPFYLNFLHTNLYHYELFMSQAIVQEDKPDAHCLPYLESQRSKLCREKRL